MSDFPTRPAEEHVRDPRVKVWPVSRIIMLSIVYVSLAFGGAWLSIGVAMDRVTDMGHYQVEKTREFLGNQRAKELEEFMHPSLKEGADTNGVGVEPEAGAGVEPGVEGGADVKTDDDTEAVND